MFWLLFFLFIFLAACGVGIRVGVVRFGAKRQRRLRARWRLMKAQRRAR